MTRTHARLILAAAGAAVFASIAPERAEAQNWTRSPSASLSAGAFFFDLSGTGTAPMLALRGTRSVSRVTILEAGLLAAFPEQQFGERTTFLAPELQVQFQVPFGWVAPYFGFGGGFVADIAGEEVGGTDFDITMSAALGVRAAIDERVGFKADARLRGIGAGFEGSASELSAGVVWRFGR